MQIDRALARGDRVRKSGGDYTFEGKVVTVFQKRIDHGGALRCVVEDDRGLLFIFKPSQLEVVHHAG